MSRRDVEVSDKVGSKTYRNISIGPLYRFLRVWVKKSPHLAWGFVSAALLWTLPDVENNWVIVIISIDPHCPGVSRWLTQVAHFSSRWLRWLKWLTVSHLIIILIIVGMAPKRKFLAPEEHALNLGCFSRLCFEAYPMKNNCTKFYQNPMIFTDFRINQSVFGWRHQHPICDVIGATLRCHTFYLGATGATSATLCGTYRFYDRPIVFRVTTPMTLSLAGFWPTLLWGPKWRHQLGKYYNRWSYYI